jgi:hypothetical protein
MEAKEIQKNKDIDVCLQSITQVELGHQEVFEEV